MVSSAPPIRLVNKILIAKTMNQSEKGQSKLVRTSTLSPEVIRNNLNLLKTAIDLTMCENITQMSKCWSEEELSQGRRLVKILIESDTPPNLKMKTEPVSIGDFNKDDLVISCIRWSEKNIDVVTSVDIIVVIEHIVGQSLSLEEKSRIRRNLQFLKPYTINKTGADRKSLFDSIMAMGNPKPRTIEKDLKVFKWTDLLVAVSKVLSKYSPNPNASLKESTESSEESIPRIEEASRVNRYPLRAPSQFFTTGKQQIQAGATPSPSSGKHKRTGRRCLPEVHGRGDESFHPEGIECV